MTSANGALGFPEGFAWGSATAAYQIEGAASIDGKGPSVWDTFSHAPGNVRGGDTGDIACDSYHRYREDVALMASLGLNAYRFSISWPRVQPGGRGPANSRGLDHYRALLDELRQRGIEAMVTLYHWDLPQELQDDGGWARRDTAQRFAEYTAICAQALGDRVTRWITVNEPQVVANNGYRHGQHAPGLRDPEAAAAATHHLLLGHGLATQALRALGQAEVGIALDLHPIRVLGNGHPGDLESARLITDAMVNGIYLESVLQGRYPEHTPPAMLPPAALIADGDLETISQRLDFLGINYYSPIFLRAGDPADLRRNEEPARSGVPGVVEYRPDELERTTMGWLVDPDGLYEILTEVAKQAPGLPLYITENGRAAEDYVNPQGEVHDIERVRYLHTHLEAAARAIKDGVSLAGYFVWSLLDNFEWAWGYQKRFGIVFVDFGTQRRIPKASARFYSEVVRANAVPAVPAGWLRSRVSSAWLAEGRVTVDLCRTERGLTSRFSAREPSVRWPGGQTSGGVSRAGGPANCRSTAGKAGSTGWANVVHMNPVSARLTFRDMSPDDLDDMALLLGDPEVMTYYPRPKTREEAAWWIAWNRGLYRTHGYGLWLLSGVGGGFVGDYGLTPQVVDGVTELEVGYHVLSALQGRGYTTEAAAASRDFARDVLGATRLIAIIHPDNRPSQRVAEKIGLHPEKRTTVHGGRDAVIYAAALDPQ